MARRTKTEAFWASLSDYQKIELKNLINDLGLVPEGLLTETLLKQISWEMHCDRLASVERKIQQDEAYDFVNRFYVRNKKYSHFNAGEPFEIQLKINFE